MSSKVVIEEDNVTPELRIDEKEGERHRLDSLSLLLYTFLLTLTVLTIWLFKHRRIRYLHETGLAIFYGLVVGAIIRYGITGDGNDVTSMRVRPSSMREVRNSSFHGPPDFLLLDVSGRRMEKLQNKTLSYSLKGEVKDIQEINDIDQKATFDPEIFFNVLLPPIIFHAGYSMKKRFFFRNIGSILAYAFLGTAISTFVVGGVMYGVTQIIPHLSTFSFLDALHFGALISSTDPVTILAIFNDLHVDVNLYALVFGESVLNDAVAIVMTRTLEDYEANAESGGEMQPTYVLLLKSTLEFCGIFGASFLVGSVMACATALLTKHTQIKAFPQLESTLFVLMSYSTFLLAEVLNLTGIVAVLFCGICQAHYTYNNLSDESRAITKQFFDLLNFMAENFIFSYIGVSMFTFPKHKFDPGFIFGSFLAIILGRALNVYPISFLLNLGRQTKISMNLQHMMFLSGLRGAIAFALSIRNTLTEARQMILTTTLLIVIVTVAVCGGSTLSLLTWLGIPLGVNDDERVPYSPAARYDNVGGGRGGGDSEYDASSPVPTPTASAGGGSRPGKSWLAKCWGGLDKNFMKPLLTHSNPTLMETLPGCCMPLSRLLTSKEQLSRHPAMLGLPREEEGTIDSADDDDYHEPMQTSGGGAAAMNGSSGGGGAVGNVILMGSPLHEVKQLPSSHI